MKKTICLLLLTVMVLSLLTGCGGQVNTKGYKVYTNHYSYVFVAKTNVKSGHSNLITIDNYHSTSKKMKDKKDYNTKDYLYFTDLCANIAGVSGNLSLTTNKGAIAIPEKYLQINTTYKIKEDTAYMVIGTGPNKNKRKYIKNGSIRFKKLCLTVGQKDECDFNGAWKS